MEPSVIPASIIAAVVIIMLIMKLVRHHCSNDEANAMVAPVPPDPTYNDDVVFEAKEIGHGVYEIRFWGYVDGVMVSNFPESLAYFIQQHPTLQIIDVCAGREDYHGNTQSMIVLTEPRVL